MINPYIGMPGVGNTITSTPREVLAGNVQYAQYVPGMHIVNGSNCADAGNANADGSVNADVLRSGNVLGKLSAGGQYASSIIGVTSSAVTTSSTTFTVPLGIGAELTRRLGANGTLTLSGPASASGTVNAQPITYTSISAGTALATVNINAPGTNGFAAIAGSFVQPADGSQTPVALLADKWGLKVSDQSANRTNVAVDALLLSGHVKTSNIVNYPADSGLVAWLKAQLRAKSPAITFDDDF